MNKRIAARALCFLLPLLTASTVCSAEQLAPLPELVTNPRIEGFKSARVLLFYSGEKLLRKYPVGLGFDPVIDKTQQGDGATPEGEYRVCVKNPQSKFLLSLGINYPNQSDAERGLRSGLISQAEYDSIVEAHEKGRRPPWNTLLGGEIFIHGRGSGSDWTLGCIALDDPDMRELYRAVVIGTPVVIHP